ncbi:hypothetical protein FEM48_Zijuj02G0098700 [Ziziphus jujuba var. spinosa]|uniref:Uncharacterized protein n=1 Tax=Ziziphus jujuba var. spinosa TaxID=714518 RepID=A0A978VV25_ZIZJJ|nr:hypothetical protein FEM48_Zijuj02G0098700 [Ziziphus jujuba var. spinosa]
MFVWFGGIRRFQKILSFPECTLSWAELPARILGPLVVDWTGLQQGVDDSVYTNKPVKTTYTPGDKGHIVEILEDSKMDEVTEGRTAVNVQTLLR